MINYNIKGYLTFFRLGIGDWGWGLGIGDWGLGIGPNPQSPIPNILSALKFQIHLINANNIKLQIKLFKKVYVFKIR